MKRKISVENVYIKLNVHQLGEFQSLKFRDTGRAVKTEGFLFCSGRSHERKDLRNWSKTRIAWFIYCAVSTSWKPGVIGFKPHHVFCVCTVIQDGERLKGETSGRALITNTPLRQEVIFFWTTQRVYIYTYENCIEKDCSDVQIEHLWRHKIPSIEDNSKDREYILQ